MLLSFPWLSARNFRFCSMKWGHIVTLPWQLSPSPPVSGNYNTNDSCYVSKYYLSLNYFIFLATTFECYYSNISVFPCQGTVADNFINLLSSYSTKKMLHLFYSSLMFAHKYKAYFQWLSYTYIVRKETEHARHGLKMKKILELRLVLLLSPLLNLFPNLHLIPFTLSSAHGQMENWELKKIIP